MATRPTDTTAPAGAEADVLGTEALTADAATLADGAVPDAATVPEDDRKPHKRRLGLWLGIPGGVLAVGAVAASLILIAPGVAIAGTNVGFHTAGAAMDAVSSRLANTEVTIGSATMTGAELGASVDIAPAAEKAFQEHPLWNISAWNPDPIDVNVTIDPEAATAALHDKAPELFTDPVDAQVAYADGRFTAVPAEPGTGPDYEALADDLSAALAAGDEEISLDAATTDVAAATGTDAAESQAASLNEMSKGAGFYIGEDNALPIKRKTLASWLDVSPDGDGGFAIAADTAAIQKVVDKLPARVDREAVDHVEIVDSTGAVLETVSEGHDGWSVGDTSGVAEDFAKALESGSNKVELEAKTVEHEVTTKERTLEVDLAAQRAYAYENGEVVRDMSISSGLPGSETDPGHFRIYVKLLSQNMGNEDTSEPPYYYTENVPHVMYFNGSEGFHGAYWHSNFGTPMSHGCVNLNLDDASWLYDWATVDMEVWVH